MALALDGLLEKGEEAPMWAHIRSCAVCREEWEALQRLSSLLTSLPMASPPPGFARAIDQRLARLEARRRILGSLTLAAGGLLTGLWLGGMALPPVLFIMHLFKLPLTWELVPRLIAGFASLLRLTAQLLWLLSRAFLASRGPWWLALYSCFAWSLLFLWLRRLVPIYLKKEGSR